MNPRRGLMFPAFQWLTVPMAVGNDRRERSGRRDRRGTLNIAVSIPT